LGQQCDLHPILVIAAILAGAAVGRILGLFLAIPVTSVLQDMLRWLYHKLADSDDLPAMPTPIALRYAQAGRTASAPACVVYCLRIDFDADGAEAGIDIDDFAGSG
jgi:hypothetical protein